MSKEKTKRERKDWQMVLFVIGVVVAIFALTASVGFVASHIFAEPNTETKTLTILHVWEESGDYYFADELGCVYLIGCWGNKGEIRYDDMPKIRFDKLEEGHRYNVKYVLKSSPIEWKRNVRASLSEEEMVI